MAYVHRIGRTGRAGRTGVAVTFVDWRDLHRWKLISDGLGLGQPEPAETYSTSEHLFTDLSIPPGVTGTLPRELRGARAGLAAEVEEDLGETGKTRSKSPPPPRSRSRSRKSGDDGPSRSGGGQEATTAKAADDAAAGTATPARAGAAPAAAANWVMRRPQSPDMSTPTSLELPEGTRRATVETARGSFAALDAMPAAGPCELGTALLVPGYTGSKEDFIAILGQLAAAGRRVVAIDLRGQYQTAGPDDPAGYDVAELGADVTAVAEATEASHLLGHSFGGLVARAAVIDGYAPASLTLLSSGPAALPGSRAEELHSLLNYVDGTPAADLKGKVAEMWYGSLKRQAVKAGVAAPIVAFLEERMLANNPTGLVTMAAQLLKAEDRTDISPPGPSRRSCSTARTTTPGPRPSSGTWRPG